MRVLVKESECCFESAGELVVVLVFFGGWKSFAACMLAAGMDAEKFEVMMLLPSRSATPSNRLSLGLSAHG